MQDLISALSQASAVNLNSSAAVLTITDFPASSNSYHRPVTGLPGYLRDNAFSGRYCRVQIPISGAFLRASR